MVRSFRHKGLAKLFTAGNSAGVSAQHARQIQLILAQLQVARSPAMMDAPGLRMHALKGERNGQFAVSVSGNWRIVFAFEGEDAVDVDLIDYH